MPRSYKRKSRVVRVVRQHDDGEKGSPSEPDIVADLLRRHPLLRVTLIEFPLLFLLATAILSHGCLYIHETYLHSYMQALHFTPERQEWEETYPRMECHVPDLTTLEPSDLFLQDDETHLDAVESALLHGAVVFPQIISNETASRLRRYVLKRNRGLSQSEHVSVIMNDHRTSFTLSATEHPSVVRALQEIGTNQRFLETMEGLLGPDPSLMEMQVITVSEGAYVCRFFFPSYVGFFSCLTSFLRYSVIAVFSIRQ